jgi:hypothetical protein
MRLSFLAANAFMVTVRFLISWADASLASVVSHPVSTNIAKAAMTVMMRMVPQ